MLHEFITVEKRNNDSYIPLSKHNYYLGKAQQLNLIYKVV